MKRSVSILLILCLLLPLGGCGQQPEQAPAGELVRTVLQRVEFAEPLESMGEASALYFPDLPEGSTVELYIGSGYFADELALITLAEERDREAALAAVEEHLAQVRSQFANYIPAEVGKVDDACVWTRGKDIVICISDRAEEAREILEQGILPAETVPVTTQPPTEAPTTQETTQPPAQETTQATQPPTEPPTVPPTTQAAEPYPGITSQSGEVFDYGVGNIIRVDNCGFEVFVYEEGVAAVYAGLVSQVADALAGTADVYVMPIPTAFGITLPDDLRPRYTGEYDQGAGIENVLAAMSENVIPVRCYENLMQHRDEYLYFRTDHHWNGRGAYYAYEAFCQAKGVQPYPLEQRREETFEDFLGSLYQNTGEDPALLPADTVHAFHPVSEEATMYYYDGSGNRHDWYIISDVSDYSRGLKYSTFAGADQSLAVFTNPRVTDGSVCLVVKESYGNALLPYLVDHYSTVYEVDYRYWSGDIAEYAREVGAGDVLFANNLGVISTEYMVGLLRKVIQ